MIRGFALSGEGTLTPLDSIEQAAEPWRKGNARLWLDIEKPTDAELKTIGELFNLDPGAIEDCRTGEQRPRVDEFADYVFIVLYGAMAIEAGSRFSPRKLAVFFHERFLITVHPESLRAIETVRQRCTNHGQHLIGRGLDFFLYTIIDSIVDNYLIVAESFEDQVEKLEEKSLDPDVGPRLLEELTDLKGELLELRRIASSQREIVIPLARGEFGYISDELEHQFRHVQDHLTIVIELIAGLRDLLNGVRDNYNATLANRLNAVMKTLTIFASIILPLTFIAGIYGMNVPLWPCPDQPATFWGLMGLMAAIATGLFFYFRYRRWL